jgi:hypothetical protein
MAEVVDSSQAPRQQVGARNESAVVVRVVGLINDPIRNARLRLINLETRRVWEAWTNGAGEAPFELPAGSYAIEIEARLYGRALLPRVDIDRAHVRQITIGMLRAEKYEAPDA